LANSSDKKHTHISYIYAVVVGFRCCCRAVAAIPPADAATAAAVVATVAALSGGGRGVAYSSLAVLTCSNFVSFYFSVFMRLICGALHFLYSLTLQI